MARGPWRHFMNGASRVGTWPLTANAEMHRGGRFFHTGLSVSGSSQKVAAFQEVQVVRLNQSDITALYFVQMRSFENKSQMTKPLFLCILRLFDRLLLLLI